MEPTEYLKVTTLSAENKAPKPKMYIKDHKMEFATLVRENKKMLFGSLTSTLTMKVKEAIWENIRAQVTIY
jgi:hypothetical protein